MTFLGLLPSNVYGVTPQLSLECKSKVLNLRFLFFVNLNSKPDNVSKDGNPSESNTHSKYTKTQQNIHKFLTPSSYK